MPTHQDVTIRVLLNTGDVVRITRISADDAGNLWVREPLGTWHPSSKVVEIIKGD